MYKLLFRGNYIMSFIDEEYVSVYKKVARIVKNKRVTANDIMLLVGVVIEVVEKQQNMTGPEKKDLAIDILKEIVRLSPYIKNDQKALSYTIIDTTAPYAIDLIIAGSRGELNLNFIDLSSCGCFGKKQKKQPQKTTARNMVDRGLKMKKNSK